MNLCAPVLADVPLELFHRPEVPAAERAACDDNFVLGIREA